MVDVTLNQFLSPFYPDPNESIWLIGFPAKGLPDGHAGKVREFKLEITRESLSSDTTLQNRLKTINGGLGLYFVVNAGGTLKEQINRINAVFCEIDDIAMQDQHQLYDTSRLRPNIRVETAKSVHAYWLVKDELTVAEFEAIQCSLIERWKTDPKIKNPNRVMRLPYFNHLAWKDVYVKTRVKIHTFDLNRPYSAAELKDEFPVVEKPIPKNVHTLEKGFNDQTWEGVMQELRYRISQHSSYRVEQNGIWGTAKGICHDGNNNTALTVNLRTGAVSCKAGCRIDPNILSAFFLEKPRTRMISNTHAPLRKQNGDLHRFVKDRQDDADERDAIRREGCGEYRDLDATFIPAEFVENPT